MCPNSVTPSPLRQSLSDQYAFFCLIHHAQSDTLPGCYTLKMVILHHAVACCRQSVRIEMSSLSCNTATIHIAHIDVHSLNLETTRCLSRLLQPEQHIHASLSLMFSSYVPCAQSWTLYDHLDPKGWFIDILACSRELSNIRAQHFSSGLSSCIRELMHVFHSSKAINKFLTIGLQMLNGLVPNHTAVGACSFMLISCIYGSCALLSSSHNSCKGF